MANIRLLGALLYGLLLAGSSTVQGGLIHRRPGLDYTLKTWPELVGLNYKEAKLAILQDYPNVKVSVVPASKGMFHSFSTNEVLLFVNLSDEVVFASDLLTVVPIEREWPELLGKPLNVAKLVIKEDMPDATIEVLGEGSPMTEDLQYHRVRIIIDLDGNVAQVPRNG